MALLYGSCSGWHERRVVVHGRPVVSATHRPHLWWSRARGAGGGRPLPSPVTPGSLLSAGARTSPGAPPLPASAGGLARGPLLGARIARALLHVLPLPLALLCVGAVVNGELGRPPVRDAHLAGRLGPHRLGHWLGRARQLARDDVAAPPRALAVLNLLAARVPAGDAALPILLHVPLLHFHRLGRAHGVRAVGHVAPLIDAVVRGVEHPVALRPRRDAPLPVLKDGHRLGRHPGGAALVHVGPHPLAVGMAGDVPLGDALPPRLLGDLHRLGRRPRAGGGADAAAPEATATRAAATTRNDTRPMVQCLGGRRGDRGQVDATTAGRRTAGGRWKRQAPTARCGRCGRVPAVARFEGGAGKERR
ncbi:hypothetical protein BU14_0126s0033 [Porphyra umbilicalis]|uniref:Uncharacterized protein n=1 Tax=Porphyra umbilicalis TaxID=2786 RepID=A0A1X6PAW3_PORUM|nr:hypothetical protein BU14_0126s0033 [Porphyra umbilicalis]|eukprot:OSX77994.1 hypothetical protein BU14_0126s0033 [Porphyra umbilicalis]